MTRTYENGTYRGTITDWGLSKAKTGTDQFFLKFKIRGRVEGDKLLPAHEYDRQLFMAINDNTIDFVVDNLDRLGYDRDNFDDLDRTSQDAFDFEGQEIELWLKHETYKGKEMERWSLANGGSQLKPLDNRDKSRLNSVYASKLRTLRKGLHSGKPAATAPSSSSDIPF